MLKKDKNCTSKKLLHKFNIDLCGNYVIKYKVNKLTKKILLNFESNMRIHYTSKLRKLANWKIKWRRKFFKRFGYKFGSKLRFLKKKIKNKKKRALYYENKKNKPNNQLINSSSKSKKKSLKRLFLKNLFKYFSFYKRRAPILPRLELLWLRSHENRVRKLPWIFWNARSKHLAKKLKRKYIRRPMIDLYNKLDLLKNQHFFCFSTLSQIRRYLKRVEYSRKPDFTFLGLEGCFLNIIFRTNLFITTKHVYNFIKLGAFSVNGVTLTNPYKILNVFDVFSVNPKFIKIVWNIFINKIRNRLILVNIPNYLDFDYKLMRFFIWRLPTKIEKKFVYYFPFFKPEHLKGVDVYPVDGQFLLPSDFKRPPRR